MMGWNELGFAGGLPSVSEALRCQRFNPDGGRSAPAVSMKAAGQRALGKTRPKLESPHFNERTINLPSS